jgi:hypothetical protein
LDAIFVEINASLASIRDIVFDGLAARVTAVVERAAGRAPAGRLDFSEPLFDFIEGCLQA